MEEQNERRERVMEGEDKVASVILDWVALPETTGFCRLLYLGIKASVK